MFRQDSAGKWFVFAERDGLKTACPFKAKAESAYSAEQIKDAQFHSAASFMLASIRSQSACVSGPAPIRLGKPRPTTRTIKRQSGK
jgi:hypothetical protein